jgi:hypothetical protein
LLCGGPSAEGFRKGASVLRSTKLLFASFPSSFCQIVTRLRLQYDSMPSKGKPLEKQWSVLAAIAVSSRAGPIPSRVCLDCCSLSTSEFCRLPVLCSLFRALPEVVRAESPFSLC